MEEARRLDLSSTEGRFRLGEIAEALDRELPAATDLHDRLALDLEADQDTITDVWFVASAFPPATRRPGLPWSSYLLLRFHPDRHELVDRAASAGWEQARIQWNCRLALPRTVVARRTSPHSAGLDGLQEPSKHGSQAVGRGPVAGRGRPISPPEDPVPTVVLGASGRGRQARLIPAECASSSSGAEEHRKEDATT